MSERADVLPYDDGEVVSQFGLGLHHVQLAISHGSQERCRQFYVDILGTFDNLGNRLEFMTPAG